MEGRQKKEAMAYFIDGDGIIFQWKAFSLICSQWWAKNVVWCWKWNWIVHALCPPLWWIYFYTVLNGLLVSILLLFVIPIKQNQCSLVTWGNGCIIIWEIDVQNWQQETVSWKQKRKNRRGGLSLYSRCRAKLPSYFLRNSIL